MVDAMFDALLDVLFPMVLLSLPTLAAIYLATFVFGKEETIAAVRVVGVVLFKGLLNIGRRVQRAALAFVSDDEAHPAIAMAMMRLDEIDERLAEVEGRIIDADVEASTPF